MVAGALVVIGLVGWALTRSVEPAPPAAPVDTVVTPAPPTGTSSTVSPSAFSIPPGGAQDPDKAVVERISAEDLHAKFTRGDVTILDVRDAAAYAAGHIPGSIHIPFSSLQTQLDSIPKGKQIVAYCT